MRKFVDWLDVQVKENTRAAVITILVLIVWGGIGWLIAFFT